MGVGSRERGGEEEEEEVAFDYARERWRKKKKTGKGGKGEKDLLQGGCGKKCEERGGKVEGLLCSLSGRKRKGKMLISLASTSFANLALRAKKRTMVPSHYTFFRPHRRRAIVQLVCTKEDPLIGRKFSPSGTDFPPRTKRRRRRRRVQEVKKKVPSCPMDRYLTKPNSAAPAALSRPRPPPPAQASINLILFGVQDDSLVKRGGGISPISA